MRFIVDLYRLILIGALAIALIFGTYLVVLAFGVGDGGMLGGVALFGVIVAAIGTILGIGITATIVSLHDRVAEISESMARIATALERDRPL